MVDQADRGVWKMRVYILEEDLHDAGFDLKEQELSARIELDHMLVIGPPGDIKVKILRENGEFKLEVPNDIIEKIRFKDRAYGKPVPAYILTERGKIGLIFP